MRPAGEQREDAPDRETKAVLAALQRDCERLRLLGEGGPDWERLRGRAFRIMVVAPVRRIWTWCLRRLAQRVRAATPPAYRAETVQEAERRTE